MIYEIIFIEAIHYKSFRIGYDWIMNTILPEKFQIYRVQIKNYVIRCSFVIIREKEMNQQMVKKEAVKSSTHF